jgi:acetylornithine deacetylase/succinyl-diaminopimelate desuccinylase-like protein
MDDPTSEVTDLLQQLIRNACVNDGTTESGQEVRSTDLLEGFLEDSGIAMERYEAAPGRDNLVARIEGSDPSAPSLLLMGHTDVVPVNPEGWSHDPFGGELIEGEVWGRGAVDMLNLTASMAVATKHLAGEGFRPKGDLIYFAVADEEAMGTQGADHVLRHRPEAVTADWVITESGGIPIHGADGVPRLPVMVGEKGVHWLRLVVKGTPGHGSQPLRTDNALVTAAEVLRRLAEHETRTEIHEIWRRFIEGVGFPPEMSDPLLDPDQLPALCDSLPLALARQAHACTHMTIAPTVLHGGIKTNVIPDRAELEVDIRSLPGQSGADVMAEVRAALGDLADRVEIEVLEASDSTASPIDTPLFAALERVARGFYPDARAIPYLTVGATDARFFRRAGSVAYGFGLFSTNLTFEDYGRMFHGDDERVDTESLRLSTELWHALAHDTVG